jgi:hypothetical protein
MKPGNLNFLEPSGPLQACNGTALPFEGIYQFELTFVNNEAEVVVVFLRYSDFARFKNYSSNIKHCYDIQPTFTVKCSWNRACIINKLF